MLKSTKKTHHGLDYIAGQVKDLERRLFDPNSAQADRDKSIEAKVDALNAKLNDIFYEDYDIPETVTIRQGRRLKAQFRSVVEEAKD